MLVPDDGEVDEWEVAPPLLEVDMCGEEQAPPFGDVGEGVTGMLILVSMCSGAVTGDDDVEDKGKGVGVISVEAGWGDTSLRGRANGCSG